jgi:hypothetical protein
VIGVAKRDRASGPRAGFAREVIEPRAGVPPLKAPVGRGLRANQAIGARGSMPAHRRAIAAGARVLVPERVQRADAVRTRGCSDP